MSTTPIRTAAKDKNLLSLNADSVVWHAGTDKEMSTGNALPWAPLQLTPEDPKAWDAILKLSGRTDTSLFAIKVAQGKEAAVDCNNETRHCSLEGDFGVEGDEGEHVIKLKGGSGSLTLKGRVVSSGRDGDISIGEWSDQSTKPVYALALEYLRHATGRPLTIVLGRVNRPIRTILTGRSPDIRFPLNSRILKVRSLCELAYWHLKRVYVLLRYRRW